MIFLGKKIRKDKTVGTRSKPMTERESVTAKNRERLEKKERD